MTDSISAFSSEVETGSREENASKKSETPQRKTLPGEDRVFLWGERRLTFPHSMRWRRFGSLGGLV
ncbi:hypothetical protein [Bradyrhizobium sp. dw_411]|uniref:hypothetical protein n=1 Tax=Bradyrhizobium sp. dw_411 TaxID=2720082 RepID=UPI001BCD9E60|nr:hypothetical protein [Bradyrhizobium sp. dw_411]